MILFRKQLFLIVITCLSCICYSSSISATDRGKKTKTGNKIRTGKIRYKPSEHDKKIPQQFRVVAHTFDYRQEILSWKGDSTQLSLVTFPSPVKTPHVKNNTVHCEYFLPAKASNDKPVPGVIVLHILGGDFPLSRLFCSTLASRGVAALFVKMPYYGPRRQQGVSVRMVDKNPLVTVKGMTQAVQDIRCAATWLGSQAEVDEKQLGIFGISLGGITASLVASLEPRFQKVCPMLAGGGMGEVMWDSRELRKYKKYWKENGFTREKLAKTLKIIDPVTYATPIKGRQVLMINASEDEVIPKKCTIALWKAFGKPKIVWYKAGHYSAITHIFDALSKASDFFQPLEAEVKE